RRVAGLSRYPLARLGFARIRAATQARSRHALQPLTGRPDSAWRLPDRRGRTRATPAPGANGGALMKIVSAAEMREIDQVTSEGFGVPSLTLMENAGSAVTEFVLSRYPDAKRIGVICGKGNNGGDGFVAARKLQLAGKEVQVVLLADRSELRGDAAEMFARLPLK